MKYVELFPAANPRGEVLKGYGNIPDLPVTRLQWPGGEGILSIWKASVWTRIKFLFDGRVNLIAIGKTHPPIAVSLGDYIGSTTEVLK